MEEGMQHLYAALTWSEVNEAVAARKVVILPTAAIEQHGYHLPVDTDNVAVTAICEAAALASDGAALCMPPVHYGFNDHNMDFPGTISIKMQHFIDYCF